VNWPLLLLAPVGIPFAAAGWWMLRNSAKAADATLRFERSRPAGKSTRAPSPRSRSIEEGSYRVLGGFFLLLGPAFTILGLLFGFGLLKPAH
jgi:hypothetical protein